MDRPVLRLTSGRWLYSVSGQIVLNVMPALCVLPSSLYFTGRVGWAALRSVAGSPHTFRKNWITRVFHWTEVWLAPSNYETSDSPVDFSFKNNCVLLFYWWLSSQYTRLSLEGAQKMILLKAEFAAYAYLWLFPGPPQLNPHFVHLFSNLDLSERKWQVENLYSSLQNMGFSSDNLDRGSQEFTSNNMSDLLMVFPQRSQRHTSCQLPVLM